MNEGHYRCHVLVCVNDRKGERTSCADHGGREVRLRLKEAAKQRWSSDDVRVSQTLCMGACQAGPNVVIYPQNIWFSGVRLDDVDAILETVEKLMVSKADVV